jgi:acyl carrier protein
VREREVLDAIAAVVSTELDQPLSLDPELPLVEALRLDSMRRLTLVIALEDHFRVVLPDDRLERVRTLSDLVRLIVELTSQPAESRP